MKRRCLTVRGGALVPKDIDDGSVTDQVKEV
jgi:hypothetical protein